jgi:hypothetical protein
VSKKKEHLREWHHQERIKYKGESLLCVSSNKRTHQRVIAKDIDFIPQRVEGKVKCFCGRESHSRYSFFVLRNLCANHEDNDMDGKYPDSVFGTGELYVSYEGLVLTGSCRFG